MMITDYAQVQLGGLGTPLRFESRTGKVFLRDVYVGKMRKTAVGGYAMSHTGNVINYDKRVTLNVTYPTRDRAAASLGFFHNAALILSSLRSEVRGDMMIILTMENALKAIIQHDVNAVDRRLVRVSARCLNRDINRCLTDLHTAYKKFHSAAAVAAASVAPAPAAPKLPELVAAAGASFDHADYVARQQAILTSLATGIVDEKRPPVAGLSETRILTCADGTKLIRKRDSERKSLNDLAGSLVAHTLGVTAPIVVADPACSRVIYMEFLKNSKVLGKHPDQHDLIHQNQDVVKRIDFLDRLIENCDRHDFNVMVVNDTNIVAIDHGHAFTEGQYRGRAFGHCDGRYTKAECEQALGQLESLGAHYLIKLQPEMSQRVDQAITNLRRLARVCVDA